MTRILAGGRIIGLLCALLLAGCGGGSATTPAPVEPKLPPTISSFSASPSWVTVGQNATLRWSVDGATSLRIDPIGPVTGTNTPVTPAADVTYVLTASNQYGSASAQVAVAVFPPPTTWFAPFPPNLYPNYGSVDYLQLFSPTAQWSAAASHIQVFKLYPYTLALPDDDLRNLFADLKRRHIAVALEQGGLTPSGAGTCSGDFDGVSALGYVHHIRDLGGSLQYIALDEPFSSAVLNDYPGACHWTVDQTIANVAATVARMHSVFPDALVGDIEIVPSYDSAIDTYIAAYEQWADAWQSATGQPFAFFHVDVQWTNNWQPAVIALSRAFKPRGIATGQIYIGDSYATNDADWIASAEQRMTEFETRWKPPLDQVVFQSWLPYPTHVLPETDPAAFTYLIDRYFRDRTILALSAIGGSATGRLTAAAGPLPGASIAVTSVAHSGDGQMAAYRTSGIVPKGARYVVFGARLASENCSAVAPPAEFFVQDFTLDTGTAGIVHADFSNGLSGWALRGSWAIADVEQAGLHLQLVPGQSMGFDSGSLSFQADGATYILTVQAMIPPGSHGNGCVIAVFQDANVQEIGRVALEIVPQPINLGTTQTDVNGGYTIGFAAPPAPADIWADYAGSPTVWPAAASAPMDRGPPLSIGTSALPDAVVAMPYSQLLQSGGGQPPYLWVGAGLPPGLRLEQAGTLTGTPTASGNYTILVSVVDDSRPAQVADAEFQLVVH
jgi:hypothetical protein